MDLYILSDDHQLRQKYKNEFDGVDGFELLHNQGRPRKRTKTSAIAAGNRVLNGYELAQLTMWVICVCLTPVWPDGLS